MYLMIFGVPAHRNAPHTGDSVSILFQEFNICTGFQEEKKLLPIFIQFRCIFCQLLPIPFRNPKGCIWKGKFPKAIIPVGYSCKMIKMEMTHKDISDIDRKSTRLNS